MKNFSPAYAAHLRGPVTTLAICWRIVKKNGRLILGTTHDRDIPIDVTNIGVGDAGSPAFSLEGRYKASAGITGSDISSSSDMSVDNMEVKGAIQPDMFIDITVADIEAGLLDSAQVTTFKVNWQDPDDFQEVLRHGSLGEISRTAEGEYRTEVRGLTQLLQQTIGRNCGDRCDVAVFGDSRCKFNVEALRITGVVTSVTGRREFVATLDDGASPVSQVHVRLWDAFPLDVDIGDQFSVLPECDRRWETCRFIYNNLINFRGPGLFSPGMDSILAAPGSSNGVGQTLELSGKRGRFFEESPVIQQMILDKNPMDPDPTLVPGEFFETLDGGRMRFETGENATYQREIKRLTYL